MKKIHSFDEYIDQTRLERVYCVVKRKGGLYSMIEIEPNIWYKIALNQEQILQIEHSTDQNGEKVVLKPDTSQDTGLWRFLKVEENIYKIQNKATKKVLDIVMGATENGSLLHQWDNVQAASQLWKPIFLKENLVKLKSAVTGKVLDLVGGECFATEDAQAQIWQDVNGGCQKWRLIVDTKNTVFQSSVVDPKEMLTQEPNLKRNRGKRKSHKRK